MYSDAGRLAAIRDSEERAKKNLADTNRKLAAMEEKLNAILEKLPVK